MTVLRDIWKEKDLIYQNHDLSDGTGRKDGILIEYLSRLSLSHSDAGLGV